MRTLKARITAGHGTVLAALVASAVLAGWVGLASAQLDTAASDETAGYIVFPKIIVDTSGVLGDPTDTVVQLTNTNIDNPAPLVCHWVNATGHCGLSTPDQLCPSGRPCDDNVDCPTGLECVPCWSETNFELELTSHQPVGFRASTGTVLPCFGVVPPDGCAEDTQEGAITGVPSDPFRGELKCYQTTTFINGQEGIPAGRNDLKGEATVISSTPELLTSAAYNAVGFQTNTDADGSNATDPLCLGGPLGNPCDQGVDCAKQYAGCPGVLILDNFFDGAVAPFNDALRIHTNLNLSPCSEALVGALANQGTTVVQFLIYNEYELRFSASIKLQCWKDIRLSDVDTRPGSADDLYSVFSAGVQGTLTGQTRIRGVESQEDTIGHGLIGTAFEEYADPISGAVLDTAAVDLHMQGTRDQGDAVCR